MFGFRDRRKFNSDVSYKLHNTLGIVPDSTKNPAFPAILAYLALVDEVWNGKGTVDDAVLHIATAYFMGISKNGNDREREEAKTLCPRLIQFMADCKRASTISESRLDHYGALIEKYSKQYRVADGGKRPVSGEVMNKDSQVVLGVNRPELATEKNATNQPPEQPSAPSDTEIASAEAEFKAKGWDVLNDGYQRTLSKGTKKVSCYTRQDLIKRLYDLRSGRLERE